MRAWSFALVTTSPGIIMAQFEIQATLFLSSTIFAVAMLMIASSLRFDQLPVAILNVPDVFALKTLFPKATDVLSAVKSLSSTNPSPETRFTVIFVSA